jgi:hypothetical protein
LALPGGDAWLDYEPAESRCGIFGGNSNWHGSLWLPLNFLAVESLRHLHACLGAEFTVELPTGSGLQASLGGVALLPAHAHATRLTGAMGRCVSLPATR